MPLHLLGKKSWNVYNADNVARVQRDEAAAKAAEEAEEQRMQEIDAQRRLAILRGEEPPPLLDREDDAPVKADRHARRERAEYPEGGRRKRKRQGEDDTEFELRLAKERSDGPITDLVRTSQKSTSSAPIVDQAGHIDLLGDERARAHAEKNEEAEKEKQKKKQEYEDQYTMRFSNAAGRDGINRPWYSNSESAVVETVPKNVFGKDDPGRKDREAQRIVSNDPLAMMKRASAKMKDLKQERKKYQEEQEERLRQLRRDERRRERRLGRDRGGSRDRSSSHRSERRRSRSRERRRDDQGRDQDRRSHKDDDRRHRRRHDEQSAEERSRRHRHER